MKYEFTCEEHGYIAADFSIKMGPSANFLCPVCSIPARRVYTAPPIHYNTQGFFSTDQDKHGDKLERMNRAYQKEYGEKPPEPAKDVPKNAREKY
jgi:predicted nucleic acid-binding Zn ribbon protein